MKLEHIHLNESWKLAFRLYIILFLELRWHIPCFLEKGNSTHTWSSFLKSQLQRSTWDGMFVLHISVSNQRSEVVWYFCMFMERFLDTAGLKKSSAYLINGVVIFIFWLVSALSFCLMMLAVKHPHSNYMLGENYQLKKNIYLVMLYAWTQNEWAIWLIGAGCKSRAIRLLLLPCSQAL